MCATTSKHMVNAPSSLTVYAPKEYATWNLHLTPPTPDMEEKKVQIAKVYPHKNYRTMLEVGT